MIHSKCSGRVVSLLVVLPLMLTAQRVQESKIPLKNWTTPLYWHANQAEREAAAKPVPQLQFSTNAVSPDALTFIAITPCRLVDTRGAAAGFNGASPFNGPSLAGATTVTFPVQSSAEATANTMPAPCGVIPSIAEAYSLNITVVPASGGYLNYVTVWAAGATQPIVSTLNDVQGTIVANAAIVAAGSPSGAISVYNQGPAAIDVVIDMNGYFAAPTDLNGNTAIGAGTLAVNTSGTANTAVGAGVLNSNTSGNDNTASGFNALHSNTTGGFNTANGATALASNTTGNFNTGSGNNALYNNVSGNDNTANGYQALLSNTTANDNTASGYNALQENTIGFENTAVGSEALTSSTTGSDNTASGIQALFSNTTGNNNTALGDYTLQSNTTGDDNTATGDGVLYSNTTGTNNTASGDSALYSNTTGTDNTASGDSALQNNTTGNQNAASGSYASYSNTTGNNNTAFGFNALQNNTIGSTNIAIGYNSGINQPVGRSNGIYIGNLGSGEDGNGAIRIGTQGTQTGGTFMAGIYGTAVTGSAVVVNSNGQLGVMLSGSNYREHVTDMGDSSSKLLELRPVNFYFKPEYDDGSRLPQYGLVAEEVAKVYPEMVGYGKDGQILTIKYELLAPMLLNELQKQAAQNCQQAEQIQSQAEQFHSLEHRLAALEVSLATGPVSTR